MLIIMRVLFDKPGHRVRVHRGRRSRDDLALKEIRQVGSLRILRLFTFQFSLLLMGDGIGLLVLFDNNNCLPAVFLRAAG